jgi:hypothetical protein
MEIETVRRGKSLQNMWDDLADNHNPDVMAIVSYGDVNIIERLPMWIEKLREAGTIADLASLMTDMVKERAFERPTSRQVLERIRQCKEEGIVLCGELCEYD